MYEQYRLAVEIAGINTLSPMLERMAGELTLLQRQSLALHSTLASIGRLTFMGGAMLGTGLVLGGIGKHFAEAASEFQLAQSRFSGMNLGDAAEAQAQKFALGTSVIATSATQLLDVLGDVVGFLGKSAPPELAESLTRDVVGPMIAINAIKWNLPREGAGRTIGKVLDESGALADISGAMARAMADVMEQAINASHGVVSVDAQLQFIKYGGAAALRLVSDAMHGHPEGYFAQLNAIEMQGGKTAGTQLRGGMSAVIGKHLQVQNQAFWEQLGLLTPPILVPSGKMGSHPTMKRIQGEAKDEELYMANTPQWVESVLRPALLEHGFKTLDQQIRAVSKMGNTATITPWLRTLQQEDEAARHGTEPQWKRDQQLAAGSKGVAETVKQGMTVLDTNIKDFLAKWTTLSTVLGEKLLPMLTNALQALIPVLQRFSDWALANPATIRTLTYSLVGLAAALAFGGTVILLTAAFKGLGLALLLTGTRAAFTVGALSSLGAAIGSLGAIAAAAIAGWMVGGYLNKKIDEWQYQNNPEGIHGKGPGDHSGEWKKRNLEDIDKEVKDRRKMREDLGKSARDSLGLNELIRGGAVRSNPVAMNQPPDINLYVDGDRLVKIVTHRQGRGAGLPPAGGRTYDPTLSLIPVAVG